MIRNLFLNSKITFGLEEIEKGKSTADEEETIKDLQGNKGCLKRMASIT